MCLEKDRVQKLVAAARNLIFRLKVFLFARRQRYLSGQLWAAHLRLKLVVKARKDRKALSMSS